MEELTEIIMSYMSSDNSVVFAESVNGEYAGVALCALRHDYVEGCETSPVGYLEGVGVLEQYRRRGSQKNWEENRIICFKKMLCD